MTADHDERLWRQIKREVTEALSGVGWSRVWVQSSETDDFGTDWRTWSATGEDDDGPWVGLGASFGEDGNSDVLDGINVSVSGCEDNPIDWIKRADLVTDAGRAVLVGRVLSLAGVPAEKEAT